MFNTRSVKLARHESIDKYYILDSIKHKASIAALNQAGDILAVRLGTIYSSGDRGEKFFQNLMTWVFSFKAVSKDFPSHYKACTTRSSSPRWPTTMSGTCLTNSGLTRFTRPRVSAPRGHTASEAWARSWSGGQKYSRWSEAALMYTPPLLVTRLL